uniref:Ribosomal protein S10 n=2 Tax=Gasterosteus aculeatus aculeatus TaxID=481459 RepID=G3NMF5_GASAC
MLMPKKNRIAIYELLFKEGVMVAKKDVHLPKHPELADKNVPNLHVMKAMQSLKSCGYVKEQFAWRHFYWYLTNEGIQYLRDFLHLPPEIVPATLRRQTRPETARPRPKGMEGERPARLNRGEADRDTYRRSAAPPGSDKKAEPVLEPPQNSSSEEASDVAEDSSLSKLHRFFLYNKENQNTNVSLFILNLFTGLL